MTQAMESSPEISLIPFPVEALRGFAKKVFGFLSFYPKWESIFNMIPAQEVSVCPESPKGPLLVRQDPSASGSECNMEDRDRDS
jgi:hypothetical protein